MNTIKILIECIEDARKNADEYCAKTQCHQCEYFDEDSCYLEILLNELVRSLASSYRLTRKGNNDET